MKRHLDDELKKIKEKLFKMAGLVEEAIRDAATALFERDIERARNVILKDQNINIYEIEIDELGHELIALYQPAAVDLRLITMVLKMTGDLERMGDQAVNIAEQAMVVNQQAPIKPYQDLPRMAEVSSEMVRRGLHAFMTRDVEEAKQVLEMDDAVDQLKDKIYEDVQQLMESNPAVIRMGVSLIMIAHNLERIGDLATNIAEDVIYLNRGIDVRHHIRERRTD
ncbi:MAG: phosphate transport system regulatory protein PhoU [Omnitrophica bacterium GWA2_52_12]|nr:MAG: phosphate transport system regulatory protein PhoU [Omnitrophica bacterium GWA2_52_12]